MEKENIIFLKKLLKNSDFFKIMKIQFVSFEKDILTAKMPITKKILQPFGYLHGGFSSVLSETVGSSLSTLKLKNNNVKNNNLYSFNIDMSINHIKNIKKGILYAKAKIIYMSSVIHFIQVKILNEKGNIISFCKMTNIIKLIKLNG